MKKNIKDIFALPSNVLLIVGLTDIVRGFMHTFLLTWSATNIAKLNITSSSDNQIFLLGIFGITNYLSGFIYILISRKARQLSPYVLMIIPVAYFLGLVGIWSGGVRAQAEFYGKYFMLVYFGVCIVTSIIFFIRKRAQI